MNSFLTLCGRRSVLAAVALLALAAGTHTARADFLVRTYADTAPAYLRSPLLVETANSLSPAPGEPLTVYRPHEDAIAPASPPLDEASLAAAVQVFLLCAIPPPLGSFVQTGNTPPPPTQPVVPPPPELILPSSPESPPGGGGGGSGTADAPEPASLLTALVGTGLAGIALWHRRGTGKKRRSLPAA